MAFGFQKSVRTAPGVKLNLSRKGVSISMGGKGFRHSFGLGGRRTIVGVLGTGPSFSIHHKGGRAGPRGGDFLGPIVIVAAIFFVVWLFR
jgi:Protein of unknown function (DUF4236)